MVISTRWGILGLLIPVALIIIAMSCAEAITKQQMRGEDRQPAKQAQEDPEEAKATERQQAAERDQAIKRAKNIGYLIGGLVSAVVLWPLGRRMNTTMTHTRVGNQSEQSGKAQFGGRHTMFFIPLEYWGFIWTVFGLFKVLK